MGASQSIAATEGAACACEAPAGLSSPPPPSRHFLRLVAQGSCPSTTSIRIALQFKGIQPDFVDGDGGGVEVAEEMPSLEHGGELSRGSPHEILGYIDSRFRVPPLYPACCLKAKARCWVAYIRDVLAPLISQAWDAGNPFLPYRADDQSSALPLALQRINNGMSKKGPFFFAKRFTMVDVYLIPQLELLNCICFTHGLQVSASDFRLVRYIASMRNFPWYTPVAMDCTRLVATASRNMEERLLEASVVGYTVLQHRSIGRHLERMAAGAASMAEGRANKHSRLRCGNADPSAMEQIGLSTQLKQLAKDYDRLLLVMQLHAQMEERIIFDALEKAKRGETCILV